MPYTIKSIDEEIARTKRRIELLQSIREGLMAENDLQKMDGPSKRVVESTVTFNPDQRRVMTAIEEINHFVILPDIAKFAGMDKRTVSKILTSLKATGQVARLLKPVDRRPYGWGLPTFLNERGEVAPPHAKKRHAALSAASPVRRLYSNEPDEEEDED